MMFVYILWKVKLFISVILIDKWKELMLSWDVVKSFVK